MEKEMPTITTSSYTTNQIMGYATAGTVTGGTAAHWTTYDQATRAYPKAEDYGKGYDIEIVPHTKEKEGYMKRLVQVIIVDPDKRVPAKDSILYMDYSPKITDMTDQELYFDINMKELLDIHNKKREAIEHEDEEEGKIRKRKLKPIKIRDLRMVVVEVAKFQ